MAKIQAIKSMITSEASDSQPPKASGGDLLHAGCARKGGYASFGQRTSYWPVQEEAEKGSGRTTFGR
ncbi:hypothetical protein CsSME_00015523 [Camellia sinensis var. sinensis]